MDWKDLYVVKFEEYFVASLHTILNCPLPALREAGETF